MIALGIDIGGTFVKFFAVDQNGDILKYDKVPTYNTLTGKEFLRQISDIINDWKINLKAKEMAVGIGIAGDTDDAKGMLRFAPNLPWHNLKIADYIKEATNCPCFVSNDANMAAWGVCEHELKNKYKNVVVITLGTGVGGGLVIEGKLYQGSTGSAGEFGHMNVDPSPDAPLCGCGLRGCLEAFCGTKGIRRMMEAAAVEHPQSVLAQLLNSEEFSVSILSKAAAQDCPIALKLWNDIGVYLGRTAANITLALNPEAIVFAGGVSRGAKYFLPAMKEIFDKQSIKTPFKNLKILLSKEGNIGGIGAALYAMSKVNEK